MGNEDFRAYLSPAFRTIEWRDGNVIMLDQRLLPGKEIYLTLKTPEQVADAIRNLVIRGAPAIGDAAAMGFALAARCVDADNFDDLKRGLAPYRDLLFQTRPTAVNLKWALDRLWGLMESLSDKSPDEIRAALVDESQKVMEEDVLTCAAIGRAGADVVPQGAVILTHCNAGALATAGYGTALGVVRAAHEQGKNIRVLADETRPYLQGARLTSWELHKDNIPVTVITDNMAGYFMRAGEIDVIVVGADRIAGNGDAANKIGTYSLAVLAKEHGIPFYVAAPVSTFDGSLASGDDIPIEERDPMEVLKIGDTVLAPEGVSARYPAFDVTPHALLSGIITEHGVLKPPLPEAVRAMLKEHG